MSIETLTPHQKEAWLLQTEEGLSVAEIARRLERDESSIRDRLRAARRKMEADSDPAVLEAMKDLGIATMPRQIWFKNDKYSIQVRPEVEAEEDFAKRLSSLFSNMPAAAVVPAPKTTMQDMMAVYPLFDVHLGLRAHAEVSGKEVDLDVAKDELLQVMSEVISRTPNARRGVIINGGDFTHQTDDRNMTRRSGNILDVSARNARTVDVAIQVLCALIETALSKHEVVEYYSVPGNHDPQNWETIQFALRERYRDNPRVRIQVRWDEFSLVEHGEVVLFVHHGDKRTPKDISMFCAAQFSEVWGRTKYRMLLTGHLHHMKEDEFPGIIWRQLSAGSARDHHAASHGYLSHRVITSMVFDERGKKFDYSAVL